MLMFVPGPGWFSQQQQRQRWSPCGSASCSARDAFTVQSTRTSPLAVDVTALCVDVRLSPGRFERYVDCVVLVFQSCRRFRGRLFPAESYWERRNLIPGNLGYWKQVKLFQPHWRCVFSSLPLKGKCNIHGSTHTLPPGQEKTWFYSSPARNMKHVPSCVVLFFAHIFAYFSCQILRMEITALTSCPEGSFAFPL